MQIVRVPFIGNQRHRLSCCMSVAIATHSGLYYHFGPYYCTTTAVTTTVTVLDEVYYVAGIGK